MIYTVTLNPAVDYIMETKDIKKGEVNRSVSEAVLWGGKGINVSIMLNELGKESVVLGFVGGFTGDALEKGLLENGIATDFVHINHGLTRINVKLKSNNESDTEINAQGPEITEEDMKKFYKKLSKIQNGDTLVLSGSVPNSLPEDIYAKILSHIKDKKVKVVVDSHSKFLLSTLEYGPFLIKPNLSELEEIFGKKLTYMDEIKDCAVKLQKKGCQNVLVSMSDKGAMLVDKNGEVYNMPAFGGTCVSSVGAGDSMVAGFLAGNDNSNDMYKGLVLGSAAGAATAFTQGIGKGSAVMQLFDSYMKVKATPHN